MFINQFPRCFVMKVQTLLPNFAVRFSKKVNGLLTSVAAFFASCQCSALNPEFIEIRF